MATLPTTGDDLNLIAFTMETQPSDTHKLDIDRGRVRGMTDARTPSARRCTSFLTWNGTPTQFIPDAMGRN